MSFDSLNHVLGSLENQERWQGRRQFQQLLACWTEVVGTIVAAQTRPLSMQRRVLQVATSSSAWAQNLAFERHLILAKLNDRLSLDLTDIRFSTAQWRSVSLNSTASSETLALWKSHPSRLEEAPPPSAAVPINDPQTAFRNWARIVRGQSQHLPLCPVCHCPTPEGELIRWAVCSLCAAKEMKGKTGERDAPGGKK
ncbi:MAG TPA: DciA family protein [Trichocoleus sp.]|jgi:predicted nucleic acid-binding Zn ribbon protein